jgi:hypothetical protein
VKKILALEVAEIDLVAAAVKEASRLGSRQ